MRELKNNYAFIDSQNLNLSIRGLGWLLDFKRFRKYLEDKYCVRKAFIFVGYVATNESLYISSGLWLHYHFQANAVFTGREGEGEYRRRVSAPCDDRVS